MFLDDESSEARPWFQRMVQRGRIAFVGMFACTAILISLAANAHAGATPPSDAPAAVAAPIQTEPSGGGFVPTSHPSDELAVDPMATASTPISAPLLLSSSSPLSQPGKPMLSDRYILLGLLMLCFAAMAAGSLALWRRSLKEILRAEDKRHHA
ncbi:MULTISPECIES: hypothetical protein [Alphaproteobacteria]|uniref:Transmembrane protein n=2 Tax=Alphaproteobacteria TaxID=28211 RepID=A0A512HEM9_9HYPH|nr:MULTISPECIES: hypothetical protein [Alphaproteobacteria]GEO83902.1 hypothetical protein RNA01_08340 [Ciceribacter naphthalenivorans]GLR21220.1 hypothetical protein GCM10007920_10060 [Ciceribacter naphthalenivorans]GLT04076.1 hypothetical protein GCM10007926_10060 [Sphingomonas psychrolutea]